MQDIFPDALFLIEESFPDDRRSHLYVLPLNWSLIVQDHLTIEEFRQTMTGEVHREAEVKSKVQIVGHIIESTIFSNIEVAEQMSTMLPRIYHNKYSDNNYSTHVAARCSNSTGILDAAKSSCDTSKRRVYIFN